MSNSNKESKNEVFVEIAKEVYNDVLQPSLKQIGVTTSGLVKIALAPFNLMIWGFDTILEKFINKKVVPLLAEVPNEKIITPDPLIAGPIIENMRFLDKHEVLQNMYAQLLANAMNSDKSQSVLPVFVEVIKQMSDLDALIFNHLSNKVLKPEDIALVDIHVTDKTGFRVYAHNVSLLKFNGYKSNDISVSIENLNRIGLIFINENVQVSKSEVYDIFFESTEYKNTKKFIEVRNLESKIDFHKKMIYLTSFSVAFFNTVKH